VVDYVSIAQKTLGARALVEENTAANSQQQQPDPAEESWIELWLNASALLNYEGIRILKLKGRFVIGVWSDRDKPEVRAALDVLGMGQLPIRYLDSDTVPESYKVSSFKDQPIPWRVLKAMEEQSEAPWIVRDRLLDEIGWCPEGMTWEKWRMQSLARQKSYNVRNQDTQPVQDNIESVTPDAVNAINAVTDSQLPFKFESEILEDQSNELGLGLQTAE
jgi:hypothetical protein